MPRQIGLGASLSDRGVDGDIDFDFFDEDKGTGDQLLTAGCCHTAPKQADRVLTDSDGPAEQQKETNVFVVSPDSKSVDSLGVEDAVASNPFESTVERRNDNDDGKVTQKGTSVVGDDDDDEPNSLIILEAELNREVDVVTADSLEDYGEDSDTSLDVTVSESDSSSLSDDSLDHLSDSEITDVTPLSSTNNSPLPSSPSRIHSAGSAAAYHLRRREAVKFVEDANKRPPPPLPTTPLRNQMSEKSIDLKILLQAILDSEKEPKKTAAPKHERSYSAKVKKNMSFTNDEVRRIDRENQLLLKKIFDKQQQSQRPGPPGSNHHLRLAKISSSGINRQRQQKKIEAENLMLLKRIQSVRPTRELSRTYLLKSNNHHHYHHHYHHFHHYHHHHHNCFSAPSSRPASHTSSVTKNRDPLTSAGIAIGEAKKAALRNMIGTYKDIDDKL